ncbi:MAG: hypothetical protein K2X36_02820, partial [Microbacteriaceae bacterium]|nr:hypothetical protein [Microbacteriaceae bacterium]
MTEAPSLASTARSSHRLDARLLVGLALVVASVAAVVGIVTAADEGEDVLTAPTLLTAGEVLTIDDLEVREDELQGSLIFGAVGDHRDLAIRRGTGQGEAELVRGPGDGIDGGLVEPVLLHLDPRGRGAGGSRLMEPKLLGLELLGRCSSRSGSSLLPHDHSPVVRAAGQDAAKLGVRPANLPNRPLVPG